MRYRIFNNAEYSKSENDRYLVLDTPSDGFPKVLLECATIDDCYSELGTLLNKVMTNDDFVIYSEKKK